MNKTGRVRLDSLEGPLDFSDEWDASYSRKENYLFEPNEEVVRFLAKFIRRRLGFRDFVDKPHFGGGSRVLDLGCGVGRHLIFLERWGLEPFGIDLAKDAVEMAKSNFREFTGTEIDETRITNGRAEALPWPSSFFDAVISHGVLDSMPFETAKASVLDVARVLRPGGLMYLDLISGMDGDHGREWNGEEVIAQKHERGTVQSYFNWDKIQQLLANQFLIREATVISRSNVLTGNAGSRWHLVVERGHIE